MPPADEQAAHPGPRLHPSRRHRQVPLLSWPEHRSRPPAYRHAVLRHSARRVALPPFPRLTSWLPFPRLTSWPPLPRLSSWLLLPRLTFWQLSPQPAVSRLSLRLSALPPAPQRA